MKLGIWLAAVASAQRTEMPMGTDKPAVGTEWPDYGTDSTWRPTGDPEPEPEHTYPHTYPTGDYYETTRRPTSGGYGYGTTPGGRPNSPGGSGRPMSGSGKPGSGRPMSGKPESGKPHSGGDGGCNGDAMRRWREAMMHWKQQQMDWEYHFNMWKGSQNGGYEDDHGDGSGRPDHGDGSGYPEYGDEYWEHGSGGDWDKPDMKPDDGYMMDWMTPIFDFMNSHEFCEMFWYMPEDWSPGIWVQKCHNSHRMQAEIEAALMALFEGRMYKEQFAQDMCDSIGHMLIANMELYDWKAGVGMVMALESTCHCEMHFVYDMVKGHAMDWMGLYECANTMLTAIEHIQRPPIDANWTVPDGAAQVLELWFGNETEVQMFIDNPVHNAYHWASMWQHEGVTVHDIVEGLNNWEVLLQTYRAKLMALGFPDLAMTHTLTHMELMTTLGDRFKHFFEDPAKTHGMDKDMSENQVELLMAFGFDFEEMARLYFSPWEETDGVNNFVMFADKYAEQMNGLVSMEDGRTFIPYDIFGKLVDYADDVKQGWVDHMEKEGLTETDHPFVEHVFANWEGILAEWMAMYEGDKDDMDHMDHMDDHSNTTDTMVMEDMR